ncbi:MAG: HAD-IA family hydrolase, partial [Candidatus Melainabacteria bacterium]|nr:HAD-IA family hydrolase [Candidatus Melainabacteria bacterium]
DKARSKFKLVIVSNNKKETYLDTVRAQVDIPTIGRAAKPRRGGLLRALDLMDLDASQVAVVGDRPLTDVLGGKRAGMKTVLVWPLKTMKEPGWITFFRKVERLIIQS